MIQLDNIHVVSLDQIGPSRNAGWGPFSSDTEGKLSD